jgi:hypothetical protein
MVTNIIEEHVSIFSVEDGDRVGNHLQDYTVSQARRPQSEKRKR